MRSFFLSRALDRADEASRSSPYLPGLANAAALYHKYMSKVPSFVLLLLSGFLMKIIIGFVSPPPLLLPLLFALSPSDLARSKSAR